MQTPAVQDTIVAVSTAWQPAAVGVIRLSGPQALALVGGLGVTPPLVRRSTWTRATLALDEKNPVLPALVYWFRAPRSYTGQDVVELHTIGSLPLLREIAAKLIERGARRALPGEFTARAFLAGRMDARQVAGVLRLMSSARDADARQASRLLRDTGPSGIERCAQRITALLARIEAGIDFVDEEDIRFVTPGDVVQAIDHVLEELEVAASAEAREPRAGAPHVAIAGLPNAGKSALFNALIGAERALVSPVLGTTRDVLSAETVLGHVRVVFQDCAGLGATASELELAMHVAAERAAEQADLVLWVHATDVPWTEQEARQCGRLAPGRCVVVRSKMDLGEASLPVPLATSVAAIVDVSVFAPSTLVRLRGVLAALLERIPSGSPSGRERGEIRTALEALRRARCLAVPAGEEFSSPELVSLELREALGVLREEKGSGLDEEVLQRIFAEFCVGK